MTKIDIISGFLGAGKTTFIKQLLKEAISGEKVVLIENEFGQIGIDGGFLKDAGIEIREMNSGCICCSLVGDFGRSLEEVLTKYQPDRVIIEPSGVGKLSDVMNAVKNVASEIEVMLNSAVTVVDVNKCRMYMKNFGEFFNNQIENAGTIVLSRTDVADPKKVQGAVEMLRQHNAKATIVTTPCSELTGAQLLEMIEQEDDMAEELMKEAREHMHEHHDYREMHEHTHEHSHCAEHTHEEVHVHTHEDDHVHEHAHEDAHVHTHEDGHVHDHHEDAHTHEHTHDHHHEDGHMHAHHHGHHAHTSVASILEKISTLDMSDTVKKHAEGIYRAIAAAESTVHRTDMEQIHFHEVGSVDALIDVVGSSLAIEMLGVDEIQASPVCVGNGTVRCAHGVLPVPAPATAEIIKGMPVYCSSFDGELLTPTGAAILKYFVETFTRQMNMEIEEIGYGFGTKEFEQLSCVRAFLGYQK